MIDALLWNLTNAVKGYLRNYIFKGGLNVQVFFSPPPLQPQIGVPPSEHRWHGNKSDTSLHHSWYTHPSWQSGRPHRNCTPTCNRTQQGDFKLKLLQGGIEHCFLWAHRHVPSFSNGVVAEDIIYCTTMHFILWSPEASLLAIAHYISNIKQGG